jgi:hypothetical protein
MVAAFLASALIIWLLLSFAHAHSWYAKACCQDRDCHPVPCDAIQKTPDGGWVYRGVRFSRGQLHASEDDGCHVCIEENGVSPWGVCIYLPWQT